MLGQITVPDYSGGSLVNLAAELEYRLTGSSTSPRLHPRLAALLPDASTYVLLLIDGLGSSQLGHGDAVALAAARVGDIDAPFPTTTTVSWATIATGLPPSQHGLLGYQLFLPETEGVVFTIKWTKPGGAPVDIDFAEFLPSPNMWERLTAAGAEPITIQPGNFTGTPLSEVLFRGCRFEAAYSIDEMVDATTQLAAGPRRLIVAYVPHVDVAAHVSGQESTDYADSVEFVAELWERLETTLPEGAQLIGTADHGHVDYPASAAAAISREDHRDRHFYGDSRATFVRGDGRALAGKLPATWLALEDVIEWWGPGPRHPAFDARAPDGILLADPGRIVLHRHSDDRMIGRHGGLSDAERVVPLLVARAVS